MELVKKVKKKLFSKKIQFFQNLQKKLLFKKYVSL